MATNCSSFLLNFSSIAQDTVSKNGPRPKISATKKSSPLCVNRYRFKIFKSKGAVIALLWCFCAFFVYSFLQLSDFIKPPTSTSTLPVSSNIILAGGILLYPIFGWLADVHFGRYNTIKWSLRLLWFVSVLFCSFFIVESVFFWDSSVVKSIWMILYIANALCLGGMLSNVIQFGIDQLADASSDEITSFLRWFCWVFFLSSSIVDFCLACICDQYKSAALLILPACLSFALCIDFFFNGLLTKEHTFKNSLTLIFRVLKYAIKNKYPRQRSAFAYWDSQRCSRIDLGKSEFGGPFSTDEVESVKTFWHIVSVIVAGTLFVGLIMSIDSVRHKMMYHLQDVNYVQRNKSIGCDYAYMRSCYQRNAVVQSGEVFLVIFIPLFEFIIYPIFKRAFNISILQKVCFGLVFSIFGVIWFICLEVVGHHQNGYFYNDNLTCFLDSEQYQSDNILPLSYEWLVAPCVISAIGSVMLLVSGGEFLCAYSPCSMKGLLFGILYGSIGFFTILIFGLLQLAKFLIEKFSSGRYGCGTWYLLSILVLCVLTLIFYCFIYKWYYRKRLRSERVFVGDNVEK